MTYIRRFLLLFFVLFGATVPAGAQEPGPHPRLLAGGLREQDTGYPAGTEYAQEDPKLTSSLSPVTRQADSVIVAFCDGVLDTPPVQREMRGRRLLGTSREALKRIFWLAYTYRMHGGEAYARRAVDELLAVSAFSDWNPSHFLDVGEMTMAAAIGYDWLYDRMTPAERKTVAQAILDKGLRPALNPGDAWFYDTEINWNSVCNAGMVYGALAVWEEDPVFCRSMLEKSVESNKLAYKAYAGGGYPEGYNYWGYGTSFQIMLEEAVRFLDFARNDREDFARNDKNDIVQNNNSNFVRSDRDGFLESSEFIRFTSTPAGNCYSFSDTGRKASGQYMQAWMAARTGDPTLLYPEMRILEETGYRRLCEERLFPMFLLSLAGDPPERIDPPKERYYQCGGTTPVFVYRSGWTSRDDAYLGVKGGLTMSSHSHCDQGSFYFEADGVTWATDLGMQDYHSLESAGVDLWDMTQESDRWRVFRIGPFSHNILTVNGKMPKVNHPVDFLRTRTPERVSRRTPAGAELDLLPVYDDDLAACRREVRFDGDDLHVIDYLQAGDSACTVRWAMCTEAEASLSGDAAIRLERDGHRRTLTAAFRHPGPKAPVLTPHCWPTTYDPAAKEADGMQYLHETDAPNPGTALVGYTFTLQPRQKAVLHVRLSRVP